MSKRITPVDVSAAICLSKFLRTCQFILGMVLLVCCIGFILDPESGWLLTFVGAAIAYAAVRFPQRESLLTVIILAALATAIFATYCSRWIVGVLADDFRVLILFPFGAILFGFYLFWRVRKQSRKAPRNALVPEPFAIEASFGEIWLSGGWRSSVLFASVVVVSLAVALPTDRELGACFLLVLMLLCAATVMLFFVPAAKAARDAFALKVIRSIARNRKLSSRQSYFLFLLRNMVRNRRALGWLLGAPLSVLGIVLLSGMMQSLLGMGPGAISGATSFSLLFALTTCWRRASQFALVGAAKNIDLKSEPFVLFLRSFMDDEVTLRRDSFASRFLSLLLLVSGGQRRFEELIAEIVWPFGKLVALGRPGEELSNTGAVRVTIDPAITWQETIAHLISGAGTVLIAVGISHGLKWEFQQFESEASRTKLSLILLPEQGSLVADWRIFAAQYKMLDLPEPELKRSLAVRFDQDGSPIFISGSEKTAEAYRVAVNMCLLPMDAFMELAGSGPIR